MRKLTQDKHVEVPTNAVLRLHFLGLAPEHGQRDACLDVVVAPDGRSDRFEDLAK